MAPSAPAREAYVSIPGGFFKLLVVLLRGLNAGDGLGLSPQETCPVRTGACGALPLAVLLAIQADAADKHFARPTGAVGRADDAFGFHLFDHARSAVVAEAQAALQHGD